MLRLLVNILLFTLVYRIVRSVVAYFGRSGGKRAGTPRADRPQKDAPDQFYEKLSPYEIEDADFEEIQSKGKP